MGGAGMAVPVRYRLRVDAGVEKAVEPLGEGVADRRIVAVGRPVGQEILDGREAAAQRLRRREWSGPGHPHVSQSGLYPLDRFQAVDGDVPAVHLDDHVASVLEAYADDDADTGAVEDRLSHGADGGLQEPGEDAGDAVGVGRGEDCLFQAWWQDIRCSPDQLSQNSCHVQRSHSQRRTERSITSAHQRPASHTYSAFCAPGTATAGRAECSRLLARRDSKKYDDGAVEADYVRIVEYAKLVAQS